MNPALLSPAVPPQCSRAALLRSVAPVQQDMERERLQRVPLRTGAGVECVKCVLLRGSCRPCVLCGSQRTRRTSAHIGPGLLPPHGSRRAPLHGLAGCDLPEAPGELFLLNASCASPNIPQSSCLPEQHRADLSLPPSHMKHCSGVWRIMSVVTAREIKFACVF